MEINTEPKTAKQRIFIDSEYVDDLLDLKKHSENLDLRFKQVEVHVKSLLNSLLDLAEDVQKNKQNEHRLKSVTLEVNEKLKLIAKRFKLGQSKDDQLKEMILEQRVMVRNLDLKVDSVKEALASQEVRIAGLQQTFKELYKKVPL